MQKWKAISLVSIIINVVLVVFIFIENNSGLRIVEVKNQQTSTSSVEPKENNLYVRNNLYTFEQGFSLVLPGDLIRSAADNEKINIGTYGEEIIALFLLEESSGSGSFRVSISDKDPGEALLTEYKKIPDEQTEYGDFGYSKPELFVKTSKNTFYQISVGGAGMSTDTVWTKKDSKFIVLTFTGDGDTMERYKDSIVLSYKETI